MRRDCFVIFPRQQFPDPLDRRFRRPGRPDSDQWPIDRQRRVRARVPLNIDPNLPGFGDSIQMHSLDQETDQCLAVLHRCRLRLPDPPQVGGEVPDLIPVGLAQRMLLPALELCTLALEPLSVLQGPLPEALQLRGHQAVLRVRGLVPSTGQFDFVIRPLELKVPLLPRLLAIGLQLLQRVQGDLDLRR